MAALQHPGSNAPQKPPGQSHAQKPVSGRETPNSPPRDGTGGELDVWKLESTLPRNRLTQGYIVPVIAHFALVGVPQRSRAADDLRVQHDGPKATQAKQVRLAFALGRGVRWFFAYSPARVPQSGSQDAAHRVVPKNAATMSSETTLDDVRGCLGGLTAGTTPGGVHPGGASPPLTYEYALGGYWHEYARTGHNHGRE